MLSLLVFYCPFSPVWTIYLYHLQRPSTDSIFPISYVLLTATGTCFLNFYHVFTTVGARRAAKTPYPNAYCSREEVESDKNKYLCISPRPLPLPILSL